MSILIASKYEEFRKIIFNVIKCHYKKTKYESDKNILSNINDVQTINTDGVVTERVLALRVFTFTPNLPNK